MGKLLRFELYKLFRSKGFFACVGVAVLMCFVTLSSIHSRSTDGYSGFLALTRAIENSSFCMLLGIFASIFVCDDYSGGTIRNIVTRGYTRTQIYFAKLIALWIGSLVMLLCCWFVSTLIGALLFGSGGGSVDVSQIGRLLRTQILLVLAYAALYNAICSAIQKTGVSVAVCVVLPILVVMLMNFIQISFVDDSLRDVFLEEYWIGDVLTSVSFPDTAADTVRFAVKAAAGYLLGSVALGWLALAKREY